MKDKRYTVTQEWTGQPTPQWVVRFARKFIAQQPTKERAEQLREFCIRFGFHLGKVQKAVAYAYPMSETAGELGYSRTGCYFVELCIEDEGEDDFPLQPFNSWEKANALAEILELSYANHTIV